MRAAASSGEVLSIFSNRTTFSSRPFFFTPAPTRACRAIAVRIPPGCTQETCTVVLASSCRKDYVNPRTANLLAEYADCPGGAISPKTLEISTICARFSRLSSGRKYLTPYTVPQKLMFISQRKSSSEISSNVPSIATPALLINRVTRSCRLLTSSAKERTPSSSATSSTCVVASALFFSSDCAVSANPFSSMSASASAEPAVASCCASARPIPDPAPVTTATPVLRNDIGQPRCVIQRLAWACRNATAPATHITVRAMSPEWGEILAVKEPKLQGVRS